MLQIRQFQEIDDYIKTSNLNVEIKFSDFLVYNHENINCENCGQLSSYRQNYFAINLDVTEGCTSSVDQFELPSISNRLTLISPNRLNTLMPHKQGEEQSKGYGIFFKPEFIHASHASGNFLKDFPFFNHFNPPSISLKNDEIDSFINVISNIEYEHDKNSNSSKEIIKNYLNILLLKAREHYTISTQPVKAVDRAQTIYDEFKWLVQSYFLELKSVSAYAGKMHISPKHLSDTIKQVSGQGALEIIHNQQLNYAKTLLAQTSKTVAEIAYELNFENPEYFSVFFKRLTGKNPMEYRLS